MKYKNITIQIEEYESADQLSPQDQELLNHARKAIHSSYAPYSEFHVGASVRLMNGALISGSNQENAAYPSGLCAERVALFQAKSLYPAIAVESLAISAHTGRFDIDHPITPCGACRQVIAEVQGRQSEPVRIIMQGESGPVYVSKGIENLLPLMFREDNLKRSK